MIALKFLPFGHEYICSGVAKGVITGLISVSSSLSKSLSGMTPLGNRILVKPEARGDIKRGSLYVPEMAQSKPQEGLVVAVGAGVTDIQVGDRILFGRYASIEVRVKDEAYLIVREPDVMAKLL